MGDATQATAFEAVIVPHRSLSRGGLIVLVSVLCGLSALTAGAFWLLGARLVAGFSGVEMLLAVTMLRYNARGARSSEVLLLSGDRLQLIRTGADGKRVERALPTAWLSAVLEERQGSVPLLWLTGRGVREQIAAALGEAEKRDLATALQAALYRLRNPVFDNPQLR